MRVTVRVIVTVTVRVSKELGSGSVFFWITARARSIDRKKITLPGALIGKNYAGGRANTIRERYTNGNMCTCV